MSAPNSGRSKSCSQRRPRPTSGEFTVSRKAAMCVPLIRTTLVIGCAKLVFCVAARCRILSQTHRQVFLVCPPLGGLGRAWDFHRISHHVQPRM